MQGTGNDSSKWALITGAASGMGRLYAMRLAKEGWSLLLVDIDARKLSETAEMARCEGVKTETFVQDLSQQDAADKVAEFACGAGVDVSLLINNAGLLFWGNMVETDPERLRVMMMVHCVTPLLLCRAFVPKMLEKGDGYVLNVSSLAAWMSWPLLGMYGNTKRFVKGFTRQLRVECRGTGVSFTNAYFGAVDTSLIPLKPSLKKLARNLGVMIVPEKAVDKALKATFSRRKGVMPGAFNWIVLPICAILPDCILRLMVKWLGPILGIDPDGLKKMKKTE